jgi:CRISPR/Cas system-associated exonuclease Cas4 (RecB family)|tara:strand:- start:100 stop:1590 length:1491 start_codon:yes stop_codon:yes gene_type:complete
VPPLFLEGTRKLHAPLYSCGAIEQDQVMRVTKTDFIHYLNCPKSFWVLKRQPDQYPPGDFSLFLQKITREGFEVEECVRSFFKNSGRDVTFQKVFETSEGLYARADVIERSASGEKILYEVKSSTSVKTDQSANHLKDACFQKICAERAGENIDRVFIVHLNASYKRDGPIEPEKLLTFIDVTEQVVDLERETALEIDQALVLSKKEFIDRDGCPCLYKSRGKQCDTFRIFNPLVPRHSIYSIPRLSAKLRTEFVSRGIFDLRDVPDDCDLSEGQLLVVQSAKRGKPIIKVPEIRSFLSKIEFPVYFFDFETYASAVPLIDGASPHRQFPVQYSLHVLEANGVLVHRDFLEREARLPLELIERMQDDIGPEGSVVSWHASFEKTRNRELAVDFPQKAAFLDALNARMIDLEDVFKSDYVDIEFDGSTSIKKVLPILCPELKYDDLDVQDGTSAMEAWQRMVSAESDEAESIAQALLRYCERDTLAMVEIYKFLSAL